MNRARLLFVLAIAVAVLAVPVAVFAVSQTFSDVPPSDWAFDDVEWLAANDLTAGCEDGSIFCPDDSVSRREMAAFTHRLAAAMTPTGFSATDGVGVFPSSGNCPTVSFTPTSPQFASFSGGVYAANTGAGRGHLGAKVSYKLNGGAWTPVPGQYWVYDGSAILDEASSSPLSGMMHLVAGNTYQFGVNVLGANVKSGGCELNVISQLALPSDTINSLSVSASSSNPDDANG